TGRTEFEGLIGRLHDTLGREPAVLDWESGLRLTLTSPGAIVFDPLVSEGALPYLDNSIDVVAISSDDPHRLPEARRVAAEAVAVVSGDGLTLEHFGRATPRKSVSIVIPVHNAWQ